MSAVIGAQVDVEPASLAVDVRTAARLLGVGTRTVELLIASGELASLHIGRCRRIRRVDVEDYLARRVAAEAELEHVHVEALPAEILHLIRSPRDNRGSRTKAAGRSGVTSPKKKNRHGLDTVAIAKEAKASGAPSAAG